MSAAFKNPGDEPGMVALSWNLNYSEGADWEDHILSSAWAKIS
jgi:hypothetical protein